MPQSLWLGILKLGLDMFSHDKTNLLTVHFRLFVVFVSALLTLSVKEPLLAQESVTIAKRNGQMFIRSSSELRALETGLRIWSNAGDDRWSFKVGSDAESKPDVYSTLNQPSRESGIQVEKASSLAQLVGQTVFRGNGLVTPVSDGHYVNGKINFRRRPAGSGELPESQLVIRKFGKPVIELSFPKGSLELQWNSDSTKYKNGLPPGTYTVRYDQKDTKFYIHEQEFRDWILSNPLKVSKLLGSDHDLTHLITVESMLHCLDEDDKPLANGDAIALIHSLKDKTDYFSRIIRDKDSPEADGATNLKFEPMGIELIDKARQAINESRWDAASKDLELGIKSSDVRTRGLSAMYLAVVRSESANASTAAEKTERLFDSAIATLNAGKPMDLFRTYNNYGNFLLSRSQDQLHYHARLKAAGAKSPILQSVQLWRRAHDAYLAAAEFADSASPKDKAALTLNLSRAKAQLADLLLSLSNSSKELSATGYQDVVQEARKLAAKSAQLSNDSTIQAACAELLAHLAFRAEDFLESQRQAQIALDSYCNAGSLAGAETSLRTIGIALIRQQNLGQALKYLQASEIVSDILRERIENGRTGVLRSGFFARRAYVNRQIVEILIRLDKPQEALKAAERAKAQSFEELLASKNLEDLQRDSYHEEEPPEIDELIDSWKDDRFALEYFFGNEACWVFAISNSGVEVHRLVKQNNVPISPEELTSRTTQFVKEMNGTAKKMLGHYRQTGKFDDTWQHELLDFYETLIPNAIQKKALAAKELLVIPYHVLHYFPFAALVTEIDKREKAPKESVMPKFLIENDLSLNYAPSLEAWSLLQSREKLLDQVNAVGIVEFDYAPDLPGVEKDLANLARNFGARLSESNYLREDMASETNIKTIIGKPGMLFFATHGENVADQPLKSYVLARSDSINDGQLTAQEVFTDEVGSGLVVMSACYTGLADRSPLPGDDLFGLQRAFLAAGANTVVSGQWDVYDATGPILMSEIFKDLNNGNSIATSLSNSQRNFIADRRRGDRSIWIHPYFWSVYTTAGSGSTRFAKSK